MPTTSFNYLSEKEYYFDTACQCLRPNEVLEAEMDYYKNFNACGGRGNHHLAKDVDGMLYDARSKVLEFVSKSNSKYSVVFTPNTTYGINLLFSNLNWTQYKQVVTTEKEHNSVLLTAQSYSRKFGKSLKYINLQPDYTFNQQELSKISNSVVIFQSTSNIDGQTVRNLELAVETLKHSENLVLIDATQTLAHSTLDWMDIDFDCLFASGHKLYAPSMGFMVIRKNLIRELDQVWVGGGTVQTASTAGFEFIDISSEIHSRLEFGLQDYAAINGLLFSMHWLEDFKISQQYPKINYQAASSGLSGVKLGGVQPGISIEGKYYIESLGELAFSNFQNLENKGLIKLVNHHSSTIISFFPEKMDTYQLSEALSNEGILVRSGFMCAHHYIQNVLAYGPVIRVSLGLHNTPRDVVYLFSVLDRLL